ncbi:MAG: hypothetical protein BJ554DRAFT_2203, partial [Olpidium bornovanus]
PGRQGGAKSERKNDRGFSKTGGLPAVELIGGALLSRLMLYLRYICPASDFFWFCCRAVDHFHPSTQRQGPRGQRTDNFEPYFAGTKLLLPRPSDLSFYNWETQTCTSNSTPNFQVVADNESGLLFKNKRDRKIINVDPKVRPKRILTFNGHFGSPRDWAEGNQS